MHSRTNVAVIGAGIIGASVAYYLTLAGAKVTVLEREWSGSGLTRRGGGMMRTHFTDDLDVEFAARSIRDWRGLRETLGNDMGWHEIGYAVYSDDERHDENVHETVRVQREHGVNVEALTGAQLADRYPGVNPAGITAAALAPEGGYGIPYQSAEVLLRAATDAGAILETGTTVTEVFDNGTLMTALGGATRSFDAIIVCTSLDASGLTAGLGLELAFEPFRLQSFISSPVTMGAMPCMLQFGPSGLCMRPDGKGVLAGRLEDDSVVRDFRELDWNPQAANVLAALRSRLTVDEIEFTRGWAGSFDETPDGFPYVGEVSPGSAVFVAAGFCGHGYMHAPAVAQTVRDLVLTGTGPYSIDKLAPTRAFATTGAGSPS